MGSMRQATVTSTAMSLPSCVLNSRSSRSRFSRSPRPFVATISRFCSATLKTFQPVITAGNVYVAPGGYASSWIPLWPSSPKNVTFRVSTPTSVESVE